MRDEEAQRRGRRRRHDVSARPCVASSEHLIVDFPSTRPSSQCLGAASTRSLTRLPTPLSRRSNERNRPRHRHNKLQHPAPAAPPRVRAKWRNNKPASAGRSPSSVVAYVARIGTWLYVSGSGLFLLLGVFTLLCLATTIVAAQHASTFSTTAIRSTVYTTAITNAAHHAASFHADAHATAATALTTALNTATFTSHPSNRHHRHRCRRPSRLRRPPPLPPIIEDINH